jgi:hypothetical protein
VYFEYEHDGKKYKFKKREGVNRFKTLYERKGEIEILRDSLDRDLYFGWNPLQDPKRVNFRNPYYLKTNPFQKSKPKTFEERMTKAFKKYYYKNRPQ